jgi:hypothetical protein
MNESLIELLQHIPPLISKIAYFLSNLSINNILEALVGTATGAGTIYLLERKRNADKENKENIQLVNISLMSNISNIETLINFKEQICIPLIREIETHENSNNIQLNLLTTNIENIEFFPIPKPIELAHIAKKHPNLIRFMHKSYREMQGIRYNIEEKNKTIERILTKGDGVSRDEFSMLVAYSKNLPSAVDSALFFMLRANKTLYEICDDTIPTKRKGIITSVMLSEEQRHLLPPDDFLPGYS